MNKFTKKALAVTTAVALLAGGGAAYGFWTADGAGSGTAATGSTVALTVQQAEPTAQLVPGGSVELQGTITNPNKFEVVANDMTVAIDSVTPAAGMTCAASNYSVMKTAFWITSASIDGLKATAPQTNSVQWMGVTLSMVNADVNQDGCKGATVNLKYTVL
jgi:hypothetical protein